MSDPLKENEALESELLTVLWDIFHRMVEDKNCLPRKYLEDMGRPMIRKFALDVGIKEAARCEAYSEKGISSPRKKELIDARTKQEPHVAKVRAELKRRREAQ